MSESGSAELFEPGRLLGFSDGVFGVAITLLVIDVRLPAIPPGADDSALLNALLDMRPRLLVFIFTFIILGMSWLGHHRKFSYIDKVDGRLLWLNLMFLLILCLVPFASSVLAEHGSNRFAFALYAGVMALTEVLSASISAYGLQKLFLKGGLDLRPDLRADMILSPLLVGVVFALGTIISLAGFIKPAHWTLLAIIPVMAFFGSRTRKLTTVRNS